MSSLASSIPGFGAVSQYATQGLGAVSRDSTQGLGAVLRDSTQASGTAREILLSFRDSHTGFRTKPVGVFAQTSGTVSRDSKMSQG
jgi:hypothetical protein